MELELKIKLLWGRGPPKVIGEHLVIILQIFIQS